MNVYGSVHGGVFYSVCDVSAFISTCTLYPANVIPVTTDINVSVLSNTSEGCLRVCSKVLKAGKRICFIQSTVFDKNGKILAVTRITKSFIPKTTV
ncbi:MAG: PaaI family thioesterase [Firmicutes bacterium]|nr:PaaI family thioesterase [Bacillota bacterium]